MYIAIVARERFLTEVRSSKELPRVRSLHTITQDDDRVPALLVQYEIDAKEPDGRTMRLVYNEVFPAKEDRTVDLAGSLLDQMQRDKLVYEIEINPHRGVEVLRGQH